VTENALVPWRAERQTLGRRELLIAFGLLLAVTTAVYLPHAFSGGFYTDDWFFQGAFHFTGRSPSAIPDMLDVGPFPGDYQNPGSFLTSYRPLQTVMLAAQYMVAGDSTRFTLALAPGLAAIQCFLLYVVLRLLGLRTPFAGLIAGVLAIGTFVDTTRLWSTGFTEMNALTLFLGGLACALRGLRSAGRRPRVLWHGAAAVLYLAAALTYEAFLVLIPLCFLAYLVGPDRGLVPWRPALMGPALRRWAVDLGVFGIGVVTVALTANSDRGGDLSPGHLLDRVQEVVPGGVAVFRSSFPLQSIVFGPVGLVVALAAAVGVILTIRRGGEAGRAARQWSVIGICAALLALVGLGALLPGQLGLTPSEAGFANRFISASAAFYAVVLVSVALLAGIGLSGLVRRPRLAAPLAAAAFLVIGAQLVHQEIQRQDDMAAAWKEEERILDAVRHAVPDPPHGAELVTTRHPIGLAGGMVSFGAQFDLDGAVKLRYDDESLRAHPFLPDTRCDPDGITFAALFEKPTTLPYGQLYFIDTTDSTATRIETQAQCRAAQP
jgi:hypothetical protein